MSQTSPSNTQTKFKTPLKFIEAARIFESSEIERVRKNAKIAWRICGVCLLITGIAVGAVAGLTPLKTVVPFLVRVDNNTGATDIVTMIKNQQQSYGEVIDKANLSAYVKYREGYDWYSVQDTFDATALMSDGALQTELVRLYKDSPNAPHKVLADKFRINIKILSISFIGKTAQVRYEKTMIPLTADKQVIEPQRYVATITYEYRDEALSDEARLINPLGFTVTSWRTDRETVQ